MGRGFLRKGFRCPDANGGHVTNGDDHLGGGVGVDGRSVKRLSIEHRAVAARVPLARRHVFMLDAFGSRRRLATLHLR